LEQAQSPAAVIVPQDPGKIGDDLGMGLALGFVGMLHRQILREERFLAQTYGDAYLAYCA
jgi:translation elongation factor EF-4